MVFRNEKELRKSLADDYAKLKSLRKVSRLAKYQGMPAGTISTILGNPKRGRLPGAVPKKWRAVYGLHQEALAPVCPIHGVVHVRKTCPSVKSYKDLFAMPKKLLLYALLTREDM